MFVVQEDSHCLQNLIHQPQWWLFSLWRFWRNCSSSSNCQCVSSLWYGLSKQTVQKLRAPTTSDRHCIEICFSFLTLLNQDLNYGLSSQSSWNTFWWLLVTFSLLISCKENRMMKKKADWWKTGDRPMVLASLTSSQGTSKFNLVTVRGGTPIFVTRGDLASWWAITYNGGTFDNLISQQIKFYIGMHYSYQLLYVLNVISSFSISSLLYSVDQ